MGVIFRSGTHENRKINYKKVKRRNRVNGIQHAVERRLSDEREGDFSADIRLTESVISRTRRLERSVSDFHWLFSAHAS